MADMSKTMDRIRGLLKSVDKEAAEEPNDSSYMASPECTPAKQAEKAPTNDNPEGSSVNKEKTDEAEAVGGNIDSVPENKDSDTQPAQVPEKTDGPDQMAADDKVTGSGQMGTIKHQDTGMEQKVAHLHRVVGFVTNHLEGIVTKEAAEAKKPSEEAPAVAKEASDEEAFMAEIEKVASEHAEVYKQNVIKGMLIRVGDELALKEAMDKGTLGAEKQASIEAIGGISAFLDKVAMENPDSIMPPEVMEEEAAMAPAADGEVLPADAGLELPAEMGGEEGGLEEGILGEEAPVEGGAPEEADLSELEAILTEMGVTDEDLEAAIADVSDMAQNGASPEEAAGAVDMMAQEQMGGEKVASSTNPRVQACYEYLVEKRAARAQG